jgi:ligand-binding sensor domain-containing protein/signal transduction histidine kinase
MPKIRWMLQFAGLLLCVFSSILPAVAGPANPSSSPFIVDSWKAEEGLPDNEAISVIQTKDGYLWIGTLHGLVRFDGIHFTVFDENNTPELSSDRIVFLFEDSHTNLWVGAESAGLVMIKNGIVKNFSAETSGSGKKVLNANEDPAGDIWFNTPEGVLGYHAGNLSSYPGIRGTFPGPIQKWQTRKNNFGPFPWGGATVNAACLDNAGNLIVGTLGEGIFWYEADGKYHHISKEQGLSSTYVLSLCLDREGNLWVGTDGGGLNRIKRKNFNMPSGLRPLTAQSVSEDERGGLWTAFNAHGVSYWDTNSPQDFTVGQSQSAWTVLVDHQQQVWVGTREEGLFQFQTNFFVPAPGAEILGPQIFALFEDRNGQLWAGTQKGLANFNGQHWKMYTTRDGLSENSIRAIAQDTNGNLWIGTESHGLNFFAGGKFTSLQKTGNGLPGNDISCLFVDAENVLWVGTFGHGLARLQNGKWIAYSTGSGLASDSIGYFIEDDAGNLWIGSNAGLMRIPAKSLEDASGGKINSISCRTYGKADGLPTRECSSGSQPAALRAHDGTLWFPTVEGLVSVNPAELKTNLHPPLLLIESVLVEGREQKTNRLDSAWSQSVIVPPGGERLEIHYTGLNFSAPEEVRFKYRLEGRDTAWTEAGGTRVTYYSNLPPGHYHFHVIAGNEDGAWNEAGSMLEVIVQPQFWQTGWFFAIVIAGFLGMVVGVVRYISTQKLRRELQLLKQQEALEHERARIARDLHDQLGANLTQVALLGEMAEADKNSPAEIESHARQISETARETTHALDEIVWAINPSNDTLEGLANYACKYAQEYLALAGLRYRADVPAQLPATSIPPEVRHNVFLAFKEAVNNVVKHAQASEVWIRLRLSPKHFILEIEDNGRGRQNPDEPPTRNGLRNMRKRMEDIRGEFSISGGAPAGTIVRLTVPIT